jgi:hypothetical protein
MRETVNLPKITALHLNAAPPSPTAKTVKRRQRTSEVRYETTHFNFRRKEQLE